MVSRIEREVIPHATTGLVAGCVIGQATEHWHHAR
jgi:hypothetical protein